MSTFSWSEWREWWDARTHSEKEQIKAKARWEHMTLSGVAIEWFGWKPAAPKQEESK